MRAPDPPQLLPPLPSSECETNEATALSSIEDCSATEDAAAQRTVCLGDVLELHDDEDGTVLSCGESWTSLSALPAAALNMGLNFTRFYPTLKSQGPTGYAPLSDVHLSLGLYS